MLVKEKMHTPVISIHPRTTLEETLKIMNERILRFLPVIENDQLVGIIVSHEIQKALRMAGIIPQTPVEWVMAKKPLSIDQDEDLKVAAKMMKENRINGLPVMDGTKVVGVITKTDFLDIFLELIDKAD